MPQLKMARDQANFCKCDLYYKIKLHKRWRRLFYTLIDSYRCFQLALIYRRISISIEQITISQMENDSSNNLLLFRPHIIIKKMPQQNMPRDTLYLFHMLFTFTNDLTTIYFFKNKKNLMHIYQ